MASQCFVFVSIIFISQMCLQMDGEQPVHLRRYRFERCWVPRSQKHSKQLICLRLQTHSRRSILHKQHTTAALPLQAPIQSAFPAAWNLTARRGFMTRFHAPDIIAILGFVAGIACDKEVRGHRTSQRKIRKKYKR